MNAISSSRQNTLDLPEGLDPAAHPELVALAGAYNAGISRLGTERHKVAGWVDAILRAIPSAFMQAVGLEQSFDLYRKADLRGLEMWRAEAPEERDLIVPDKGRLVAWLLHRLDAAAAEAAGLRADLEVTDERYSARVTELLEANNREVERRRAAEREVERLTLGMIAQGDKLLRADAKESRKLAHLDELTEKLAAAEGRVRELEGELKAQVDQHLRNAAETHRRCADDLEEQETKHNARVAELEAGQCVVDGGLHRENGVVHCAVGARALKVERELLERLGSSRDQVNELNAERQDVLERWVPRAVNAEAECDLLLVRVADLERQVEEMKGRATLTITGNFPNYVAQELKLSMEGPAATVQPVVSVNTDLLLSAYMRMMLSRREWRHQAERLAALLRGFKARVCESEVLRDPKLADPARGILQDLADLKPTDLLAMLEERVAGALPMATARRDGTPIQLVYRGTPNVLVREAVYIQENGGLWKTRWAEIEDGSPDLLGWFPMETVGEPVAHSPVEG